MAYPLAAIYLQPSTCGHLPAGSDLSALNLPVLDVVAEHDGVLNRQKWQGAQARVA